MTHLRNPGMIRSPDEKKKKRETKKNTTKTRHKSHGFSHVPSIPPMFHGTFRSCRWGSSAPTSGGARRGPPQQRRFWGIGGMKRKPRAPVPKGNRAGVLKGKSVARLGVVPCLISCEIKQVRTLFFALGFNGGFLAFGLRGPLWNTSTLTSTIFACKCIDRSAHSVRKDCAHCAYSFDLQRAFERILTVRTAGKMSKSRSSSREVGIRVPFFSVVYFSRGTLPQTSWLKGT